MRIAPWGAALLALVFTLPADADTPPLVPGGAAGLASVDPVPNWSGPSAVDYSGGDAPDSAGHAAYRSDRSECGEQIGKLGRRWDTGGIIRMTAQGGVQGAAAGAPAAAINPLAVAITAIAGAGGQFFTAITNNLGFFTTDAQAEIAKCMDRRSIKSGLYTVTE